MTRLDIDLRIPIGEEAITVAASLESGAVGVFGPSGAGKTTLLAAIAGLRRAEGTLRWGDETWNDSQAGVLVPPEDRRVGWVPQDGLLFPHLDVEGNILAGMRAVPDDREWQGEVVELLELSSLVRRSTDQLSGGERQRVALARALCGRPGLLLLDEPLGSLDRERRWQILPFLRRIREVLKTPLVLVSHDATEIQAICEEVLVLDQGRVVDHGVPGEVLLRPGRSAEERGFENVLAGRLKRMDGAAARRAILVEISPGLQVEVSSAQNVPADHGAEGTSVMVSIAAQQILVSLREPEGLSARNGLAAVVDAVEVGERQVLVHANLVGSPARLVAEVTREAVAELDLVPGASVWLVFKTSGCRLLG